MEMNLASCWEGVRLSMLLESPWTSPEVPELPGNSPASSLTVEINNNPEVPQKFPRLLLKFPGLPRKFAGLPWGSAPFSGKPDTLS